MVLLLARSYGASRRSCVFSLLDSLFPAMLRDNLLKIFGELIMSTSKTMLIVCFTTPFLLSACQSGSSSTAPTAATTVATQGTTFSGVTAADIQRVANGGVDWSGLSGPFPTTISGGDGFQANPTNDASFGTLINSVRTAAGAPAVAYNAQLDAAAQAHSQDMVTNGYFSHFGNNDPVNGSTMTTRAAAAGYTGFVTGENIAQGQANENLALNGWISSPGHHRNNVNPASNEFGLGRAGTGANTTWVLMFGRK